MSQKTVMVVEDFDDMRLMMRALLEVEGSAKTASAARESLSQR